MPIPEDERFESYLKRFRPVAPESLEIEQRGRATRRNWVFPARAAAVAIVLVAAVLLMPHRSNRMPSPALKIKGAAVEQLSVQQSLTLGSANALLARAPSVKAAVDQMVFQVPVHQVEKNKQSALAVLSKENP